MTALRGEQHHAHRLTREEVREIRGAYAPGRVTQRELAEQYGVTQQAIANILTRRNWRHLR